MNFVTQVIEQFSAPGNPTSSYDAIPVKNLCQTLENSVKFLLPKNGDTGVTLEQSIVQLLRMPYPVIAFEYEHDFPESETTGLKYNKRIALAQEVPETDGRKVDILSLYEYQKKWFVNAIKLRMDFTELDFDNPATSVRTVGVAIVFPEMYRKVKSDTKMTDRALLQAMADAAMDEVRSVMRAIACLNAKNVFTVTLPAPEKLNKKRKSKGKPPFYDYKTLSIFLSPAVIARPKDRSRIAQNFLNSETEFRLTKVRGHFKRKNGNLFWWRNYFRGNAKNGSIDKQYKLVK